MEAVKAYYDFISTIGGLSGYVQQSDGSMGVYFDHAPQTPDGTVKAQMPYVVFNIENQHGDDAFNRNQSLQYAVLHVQVWIKGQSEKPLSNIRNLIRQCLDRPVSGVPYPNGFLHRGCKAWREVGPLRNQEYWCKHLYFKIEWAEVLPSTM